MNLDAHTIEQLGHRALLALLRDGHPVDPRAIENTAYQGISLGLPRWLEERTWKKFRKTFCRDAPTAPLRGWNVRLEQNGIDAEDRPLLRGGQPHTFGHYTVLPAHRRPRRRDIAKGWVPRRGLLLDYGAGEGPVSPLGRLRDPLVAVNAGDVSLLLGWSYLDLGVLALPTPSFFLLHKPQPLIHRVPAPR